MRSQKKRRAGLRWMTGGLAFALWFTSLFAGLGLAQAEQAPPAGRSPIKLGAQLAAAAGAGEAMWDQLKRLFDPLYPIVDGNVRMTPDGRYAAFIEYKFVSGELHSTLDLYDRETGSLEVLLQEVEAKEPVSFEISPDARWIAYTGKQRYNDLVDAQVYLYDRTTKENRLVSAKPNGLPGTGSSENPSVSADGRFVAFESGAPDLVEGDSDNYDVFVYDRETGHIEKVSEAVIAGNPTEASFANSGKPSISADGRYVAFESDSAVMTEGDTNGAKDVFLHDRNDKTNRLVSVPAPGGQSASASGNPKISGDGGVVAFESYGALVGDDTNDEMDIYVYRTTDGSVKRVSVNRDGAQSDYESYEPLVTADGRYVTFDTLIDADGLAQSMIADLAAGVTKEVSVAAPEEELTLPLTNLALSDGAAVGIFNAGYTYTDPGSGEEIPMSNLFIASKNKGGGETPTWPDASKLEASGLKPDQATLSWTPASAAGGIKEYRIYANNERIAVVNGSAQTYTAAGLKPATEYVFRVEAVSAGDVVTAGGPSIRVTTPADDRTLELGLTFDRLSQKRQPVPDSTLTLEARAVTGRAVAAKIVYATWLDEDGKRLPAPRTAEASVDLAEKASGTGVYTGSFPVSEGISELTKVTAVMTGASGGPVEKKASGLPLAVSGNLKIAFDNPGGIDLNGAYLSASSVESGGYAVRTLTGGDDVLLEGLKPSDAYAVTIVSPTGKVLGQASSVQVTSGWRTDLSLKVIQPARYKYKVTDEEGKPLAGIHIETWDEAEAYVLGGYDTDAKGETNWTEVDDSGKKFTAKADLDERSYEPMAPVPFSLKSGDNVIPVTLTRSPQGQLQGKVLDAEGKPVFNALVTTTQMYKGKPVVQQAYTDLNGAYKLSAYEGEVAVQTAQTAYHYNSEPGLKAIVAKDKTTTLDIPVAMAPTGMVTFKVHVKMIGSEWQGPVDMEQVRFSASLKGRFGGRTSYYQNAVNLQGSPGEKVEVCITGVLSSAFQACKDIVLDSNSNGTAEVWVEESGGLITGKVNADSNTTTFASLFEVTGAGLISKEYKTFRGDNFLLHAPKAGTYRVELTRWNTQTNSQWSASRQVTIAEQETLELGLFELAPAAYFAQRETNGLLAEPNAVPPGGTVNLKAFYQNGDAGALADAAMKIDLPEGMSPVGASSDAVPIKVNGKDTTAKLNGRTLTIQLGAVGKKAQGAVSLQARLDAEYAHDKARLSARIEGTADSGAVSETIGTVQLEVPRVTLEAPDIVTASGVQAIGLAPAFSTVNIYDDDLLLGTATATSAGTWRAKVDLRNEGASDIHLLWAEAKSGSRTLRSDRELVTYKAGDPVLQELALAQYPNGKWLKLNVENGIAQLPYTVVLGNPFALVLKFSDPDKVKNVKLYMGGQIGGPVTAEKGGDGLYRATIPTGTGTLGGLYVDYDKVKPKIVISREAPTESETNALLPPKMRTFNIVDKQPFKQEGNVYSGSAVIEFPEADHMRIEASERIDLTPTSYFPTVEEIVEAEATGILMYNTTFNVQETPDGLSVKMKGYMPKGILFPTSSPKARASTFAAFGDDFDPLEVLDDMGIETTPYQQGMIQVSMDYKAIATEAHSSISDFKDQYDSYKGYAGKITKIMDNVQAATLCPENIQATGDQAGKALLVTVGGEIAKTALGAWTGAMMLEGPAGFIAGYAGKYVSNKIDGYVDEQIDKVSSVGPTNPESCRNNNDDDPEEENIYKKKLKRVARLRWIYDPSGYVYEAVPGNRLEDVKATVLFKNPDTGEWKVWNDAADYGQINPQTTDKDGRYGWDVPEGTWKVVWEKPGYETAVSEELPVPPPHFDVNAGLVSKAPPVVTGIEAVVGDGGSYIDIAFSKYLKAGDPVPTGALSVTGPDGSPVEGAFAYLDPQSTGGETFARKVRFAPSGDGLAEGTQYRVAIEPGAFVSYAGAAMLAGYDQQVTAARRIATGPVPASAEAAGGGAAIRIVFDSPLAAGSVLDPGAFAVKGTDRKVLSAVVEVPEMSKSPKATGDMPKAVVLTLSGPVEEGTDVTVTVAAGAAADPQGNPSAERTLALNGPNAMLSGLEVQGGTLGEAFSGERTDYSLKVSADAASVELKATLAQAGGRLSIRGVPLGDAAFKKVAIPSDGIIPIRVEAAGHPDVTKVYTLTVVRTTDPGPTPSPSPTTSPSPSPSPTSSPTPTPTATPLPDSGSGGGATPTPSPANIADIGRGATVTAKDINGRKTAVIALQAQVVLDALKMAKSGEELYLEAPANADSYDVSIPAGAFRALAKSQMKLRLKAVPLSIVSRTDAWAGIGDGATAVHLLVDRASAQEESAWQADLKKKSAGLHAVTGLYRVTLAADDGGNSVLLTANRPDAATGGWTLPQSVPDDDTAAVYRYDPSSERWRYASSVAQGKERTLDSGKANPPYYGVFAYRSPFADIANHWAKADIDWLAARLSITGISAEAFEPNRRVTRAEFAAMLARIVGETQSNGKTQEFSDVLPGDWFYEAVQSAAGLGLIAGDGSGRFRPDEFITREQMAVMVWRTASRLDGKAVPAAGDEAGELLLPFADRSAIRNWARTEVASAIKNGLLRGVGATRFDPEGAATRAQAAAILRRMAEKADDGM